MLRDDVSPSAGQYSNVRWVKQSRCCMERFSKVSGESRRHAESSTHQTESQVPAANSNSKSTKVSVSRREYGRLKRTETTYRVPSNCVIRLGEAVRD